MPNVMEKPKSIFKTFLDIVLPPVCYVCGESCSSKYGLCDGCLQKISPIIPPFCSKCGRRIRKEEKTCVECTKKTSYVKKAWACCYYKDTIKDCVHLFKYNGYLGLVDIFKDLMNDFAIKHDVLKGIDLIVPIPIYSAKKRERTYNHAEILARNLSKRLSVPIDTRNLKKIKWTRSQSELDKKKRFENVNDTFLAIDKGTFLDKNVLLVDDVYTTGATINECAKILLLSGAKNVFSLTLARGL